MAAHLQIGLYPGTFDPITYGHIAIIQRAMRLVDHLIIAVAESRDKKTLFSLDERVRMIHEELAAIDHVNIDIKSFDMLLMDFATHLGARVIIRGLRAVSDFEYEFQMAWMNAQISTHIETIFLMASAEHQFVSSRLVKEISRLHGNVTPFVSDRVAEHLRHHLSSQQRDKKDTTKP